MAYKHFRRDAAVVLAVMTLGAPQAGASGSTDADTIRALRLAYNRAIEARDAAAFAKVLSPTVSEMISTGEVVTGATAVAESYAAIEFKDPTFIAYDRQPDTVEVSPNGRFAAERGHWRARYRAADGSEVSGSGVYQAGWIRTGAGWRIQTEAYVQFTCKREPDC